MNLKLLIFCALLATGSSCAAQLVVNANDPHIHYMGRIKLTDNAAELSWSGSSAKINFEGSGIKFWIADERRDNYFNVILDGNLTQVLHTMVGDSMVHAISGLTSGQHSLELFKRTEWAMGKAWLYKFEIEGDAKLLPATLTHERKIEFFGNSITCGYADIDTTGQDRGTSPYEDGYLSYAAITARHFNAEFYNTSKSGIGITVSWFPLIMSEMYDRLDARDPNSKWDFSKYTPQVVVINLFQNDSWIINLPNNDQFKARYGAKPPTPEFIINAYQSFVKTIRSKYPGAKIICILGSMDATKEGAPWPGYIDKAVAGLNDKNIYTHFIPYKNTNGHPSLKEQQAMADDLIGFMEKNIKW